MPDHDLLPDLTDALRRIGDARLTTSYLDDPVLPAARGGAARTLAVPARSSSPWSTAPWTRSTGSPARVVRFGDHVLVENPAFPPVLDLLDAVGASVVGVADGRCGSGMRWPKPSPRRGARDRPGMTRSRVYLQPRAHNPTGVSMTAARAEQLADVLAGTRDVIVVEDDHAGDIATAPAGQPRHATCPTGPCTSAASPRATAPTCGWPPSAARPT